MWHHGFMQAGCFGGGSFMMIGWVLIIGLIIYFVMKSADKKKDNSSSAEELLKMRFVKGEIDEKEYEEKLLTLRK